jgi:hypothetical protein
VIVNVAWVRTPWFPPSCPLIPSVSDGIRDHIENSEAEPRMRSWALVVRALWLRVWKGLSKEVVDRRVEQCRVFKRG